MFARHRAPIVASLLLASCHEAPAGSPSEPSAGAQHAELAPPADGQLGPSPARATVTVSVTTASIAVGDESLAQSRPTGTPGRLDESMVPSYSYPQIEARLSTASTVRLEVDPTVSVGLLRSVAISLPESLEELGLSVGGASPLRLTTASSDPVRAYLRPRRGRWELRVDEEPRGGSDTPQTLGAVLRDLSQDERSGGIAVDLPDTASASEFWSVATIVSQNVGSTPVVLPIDYAPCLKPPKGMVCIPGGPVIVGSDRGRAEEKPERELRLSTFYVDIHEVSNGEYDECHASGACPVRINRHQSIMKPFVGPDQPAMPMDWPRARAYCAWAGKQLPTEWEWEKAARGPDGDLYPWGDEEPTCDKAVYRECAPFGCTPFPGKAHRWDCNEHATKPVGSFAAGHYGLFDMAGNGYEWTRSAGVETLAECGDACTGRDPAGPCDGAFPCNGRRILRGGSWYWPKHRIRSSHRRLEKVKTGSHRLGMRCATPNPYLTTYPPRHATVARPRVPLDTPAAKQVEIFASVKEDPIEDKPMCDAKVREAWGPAQAKGGRSTTECRDPFPYVMSNEPRGHVWSKYIENLGGAYVGIGSDQNYSYIAQARAKWAWVVDYDPRVYRNHLRLRAFILAAETPREFVAFFEEGNERKALALLKKTYEDDPDVDDGRLRYGYKQTRDKLLPYFEAKTKRLRERSDFGWLRNADHYRYIRTMFEQGRMRPIRGDLLAQGGAIASIGQAARDLGVPVRIYYTSNAPSSWGGDVTPAYRANILGLPFDEWSVVLQTNSRGGFAQRGKWHHNVTWGAFHHARLRQAGYDTIPKLLEDRIPGDDGDLTLLGLPSDADAPVPVQPPD